MKYLVVLVSFCWLASCSSSRTIRAVQPNDRVLGPSNTSAFEKRLEKLRQQYHIPSLSMGIVNGGKLVWYKGLGYADIENRIAPDTHTVYHVASVTKPFGSIILMQLVEQGKVSLDDSIGKS